MRIRSMAGPVVLAAITSMPAPPAAADDDRGALLERIDELVSDSMEATQTPGISDYRVEDGVRLNDEPLSMLLPFSAGDLGSSVLDLVRWTSALGAGDVVAPDSLEAMTTRRRLPGGDEIGYGLGLQVGEMAGRRKISHGGGINGFLSQLSWYPDDELVVAVLSNSTSAEPAALEARIAGTETMPIGEHRFVGARDREQIAIFEMDNETGRATHLRFERWGQVQRGKRVASESTETE